MFDFRKLEGRIVEKFGSRRAFAQAYGISENSMSKKLNGRTRFSTDDIIKMSSSEYLDIPSEEYTSYFFTQKSQEIENTQSR